MAWFLYDRDIRYERVNTESMMFSEKGSKLFLYSVISLLHLRRMSLAIEQVLNLYQLNHLL